MRAFLFLLVLLVVGCAQPEAPADPAPEPALDAPLTVESAWARPAATGGNSALYVTLAGGSAADTLLSAASASANVVEIHESFRTDDGMMSMRPVAALPVPAGETVALAPGGYHVMLIDMARDLPVGEQVAAVLTFARLGPVSVMAQVSETAPDGASADEMEHDMEHGDPAD